VHGLGDTTHGAELIVLPDDGEDALLAEWRAARTSLDVEEYQLTDDVALALLCELAGQGIRVRVLLEPAPYGSPEANRPAFAELAAAGVDVRWASRPTGFVHAKAWLADEQWAVVSTSNLTFSGLKRNRELTLRTADPATVHALARVLEQDRDNLGDQAVAGALRTLAARDGGSAHQESSPATPGGLVVSPVSTRAVITGLLESARTSLAMATELFDDPTLAALLAKRAATGVSVLLLLSATDAIPASQAALLVEAGVDVRVLDQPYLHAKAVLADGARYLVGSPNLTRASLDVNRELGLRGGDAAVAAQLAVTLATDAGRARQLHQP